VSANKLDEIGVVMDFHELQRMVDQITQPMHNRHLNDLPAFASRNPSAENVALHLAESLRPRLPGHIKLQTVQAWETYDCRASWRAAPADAES
jgi:6-pyruvoyltetrahydropterin/6-carboxytetrahydropterin synthase